MEYAGWQHPPRLHIGGKIMRKIIKVNRRTYELYFAQKKFFWSDKLVDGTIEVTADFRDNGYWAMVTFEVTQSDAGRWRVSGRQNTSRLAPTSLAKLKDEILDIVNSNEDEMKRMLGGQQ